MPGIVNRANVGINGGRPTWTELTQDGINIQDNFIRTNSLEFVPNRPTTDNVGEFSITTAVQGADNAGGATQVRMVTPSGTNAFKGNVYEYNRNSQVRGELVLQQAREPGAAGVRSEPQSVRRQRRRADPARASCSSTRTTRRSARTRRQRRTTHPGHGRSAHAATSATWRTDGSVREANVLQLRARPSIRRCESDILSLYPSPDKVNSYDSGDSRADRILNTGAVPLPAGRLQRSEPVGGARRLRAQHRITASSSSTATFRETDDRTDLDLVTLPRRWCSPSPPCSAFVGSWRWVPSSRLQNELRIGGNLAPGRLRERRRLQQRTFNVLPSPAVASLTATAGRASSRRAATRGRIRCIDSASSWSRQPPAPVRRQPAADQGQPVQLRRPFPRAHLRIQLGRSRCRRSSPRRSFPASAART